LRKTYLIVPSQNQILYLLKIRKVEVFSSGKERLRYCLLILHTHMHSGGKYFNYYLRRNLCDYNFNPSTFHPSHFWNILHLYENDLNCLFVISEWIFLNSPGVLVLRANPANSPSYHGFYHFKQIKKIIDCQWKPITCANKN